MFLLETGDLFWRENIKLIDSDKIDYLQKEQTANECYKPALKSLRVGRETDARPILRTGSFKNHFSVFNK